MTDMMTTFYDLDANNSGSVTRLEFEQAMVELGYAPEQAARMFSRLDADGDGMISMEDWTSDASTGVAYMLAFKLLRHRLKKEQGGQSGLRPRSTVTDQRFALEMLLGKLGVTAKTDFLRIKDMFADVDQDKSGDVDSDELALTVEKVLKQRISKSVKASLLERFDKNGDGTVTIDEFLGKVVPFPMATLYAYLPGSVVLA